MESEKIFRRYQELQEYSGWTEEDALRVQSIAALMEPYIPSLIDDFYEEIDRHPDARKVITGGEAQVQRLKGTLRAWLRDLLNGPYDREYVIRRWRVGKRHVEIGLDQVYTNVALSRLRKRLLRALEQAWQKDPRELLSIRESLNTLIDLDLAKIEDAYQTEHFERQQRIERFAALGKVAGGVAHELRNPLNVVKTSVYFLLHARNPKPEKVTEHLRRIEKQVAMADAVITALTNFARMPVPSTRPFSIAQCLKEVIEITGVPGDIQITVDCPPSLPPALGDVDQLRIVFGNLIRNAREAMPKGGHLTLAGRESEGVIHVDIKDTGTGIAPEDLHRIMEPLYSTKARGLGLGLAIAREILIRNHGQLQATSELGRGTTMTVSLPAAVDRE
jgi:signal transduction histidine kinase